MRTPYFEKLPDACLVDDMLHIRVRGVQRGDRVAVRLFNAGAPGSIWLSEATFVATGGEVDLSRESPISGSYEGADPMGLFWSRAPTDSANVDAATDPMTVTFSATIQGGGSSAPHRLRRSFRASTVRHLDVREDGLVAKLFEPEDPGPHPALLVVGGSGGAFQWSGETAALLASRGFVALAVSYFGMPGLPPTLDRIPIEYFGKALGWLQRYASVNAAHIGVVGVSRGGELALLLGATYPDLHAVVAYVPSAILWSAFPSTGHGSWTWQGRELPFAGNIPPQEFAKMLAEAGVRDETPEAFELCLRDASVVEAATIHAECINGPVLIVTGQADGLWPCERLTSYALARMRARNFSHEVQHLCYAGAGHGIGWPNVATTVTRFKHPVSGDEIDLGGSASATAHASRDSWPRVLAFLRQSLNS
jgi:dienelactone hydrolase